MSVRLPASFRPFVDYQLSLGRYSNEDELLFAAMSLLQEMSERHYELRGHVQEAIKQAQDGLGKPLDMSAIELRVADKAKLRSNE